MKGQTKSESGSNNTKIYHNELNLEYSTGTTYWLITEVVDNIPVRTFFYRIPDSYKNNSLLGGMHERYCMYCPN